MFPKYNSIKIIRGERKTPARFTVAGTAALMLLSGSAGGNSKPCCRHS